MRTPEFPKEIKRGSLSVTIYLTPTKGYDAYTLSYYEGGRRKRETSADYTAILNRANEVLDDLDQGRPTETGTLKASDRTEFVRAKQAAAGLDQPIDVIVRHYAHAVKLIGADLVIEAAREYAKRHVTQMVRKTVKEVVEEFLAEKEKAERSDRHVETLKSHCNRFASAVTGNISSITAADVDLFLDGLDVANRTRDNFINSLNNLFEFAKRKRYVPSDNDEISRVARLSNDEDGPIEIFTPAELQKLLEHATKETLPFILIGAFAGLRSSEILRLDWQDVKFESDCIIVQKGKVKKRGKSRRTAPLPPNLKTWLEPIVQTTGPVWPHSKPYLYESLAAVALAAEVPWKDNALRHSFVSYRVAKIKDIPRVAFEAGNSPDIIHSNYRELVTEKEAETYFSITPTKRPKPETVRKESKHQP